MRNGHFMSRKISEFYGACSQKFALLGAAKREEERKNTDNRDLSKNNITYNEKGL